MIKEAIYDVINGKNLDFATAKQAMKEIMEGTATNAQIGGFLTALRLKGETIDEITAFAQAMREKCSVVKHDRDVFEIVGTGGDEANTFNISTTAGFIIASAGVQVATSGTLVFEGVPSDALYILHHLDGGTEERIFTYEDGKINWY